MALGRTTRLQAVNQALTSAQLAPVESLESGDLDAETVENILDETTVEVLTRGWYWNTQIVTLSPDVNQNIVLSDQTLKADAVDPSLEVVLRGLRLYDIANGTFRFSDSVCLKISTIWEFEELPQTVRRYITMKTARLFQERTLGDSKLDEYIIREEQTAWQQMQKEEIAMQDYNHIKSGKNSMFATTRVYPYGLNGGKYYKR